MKRAIIGIDPGGSGAIAIYANGRAQTVKMPKETKELDTYLRYLKETYGPEPIVFIEKVQAFVKDDDAPGKKFMINKMLANYQELLTIIKLIGFDFVQVYPVSWQSTLGFNFKGKDLSKSERKKKYAEFSQNCFPEVKVTLATADALCLLQFAFNKISGDINWIAQRLENGNKKDFRTLL